MRWAFVRFLSSHVLTEFDIDDWVFVIEVHFYIL